MTSIFDAAEDAHGAANPESHRWADRFTAERYLIQFSYFEDCETREGKTVETIVGKLRDGSYSREWLFPPEDPSSRGWRAQQIEFIEEIRPKLKEGDLLVMELGAERPTLDNPDRKTRPFKGSHHSVEELAVSDNGTAGDEATEAALFAEREERDAAGELGGAESSS